MTFPQKSFHSRWKTNYSPYTRNLTFTTSSPLASSNYIYTPSSRNSPVHVWLRNTSIFSENKWIAWVVIACQRRTNIWQVVTKANIGIDKYLPTSRQIDNYLVRCWICIMHYWLLIFYGIYFSILKFKCNWRIRFLY